MKFIAHRGYMEKNKIDNSYKSIDNAYHDDYFEGIELDVRETKDHVFVLNHGPFYKGKLIKGSLVEELEGIVILKKVLRKYRSKILMLEIKDPNINLKKLNNLLNRSFHKYLYISSFYPGIITNLKKYKRNYKIGILNIVINSLDDYKILDFVCLHKNLVSDNIIKYFLEQDIEVFVYGFVLEKNKIDFKSEYKDKLYFIVDEKNIK